MFRGVWDVVRTGEVDGVCWEGGMVLGQLMVVVLEVVLWGVFWAGADAVAGPWAWV